MYWEWQQDLATGNEMIDGQHRELFRRVNALLLARQAGTGEQEFDRVLGYLREYVRRHFAAEERLLRRIGSPDYHAHRREHSWFTREVHRFEEEYAREGGSLRLTVRMSQMLFEWLRDHISSVDREMAVLLCRQEQQSVD